MSLAIITLLPILAGFGLLYWGSTLVDDEWLLRLIFQFLFIPLCWISVNLGVIDAKIVYSSDVELVSTLSQLVEYLGYVFFIVGVYYFFRTCKKIYDNVRKGRADREAERHGEG